MTAAKTKPRLIINAAHITTPLGPMVACASDGGVCLLEFSDQKNLEPTLVTLKKLLNAEIVYANHPLLEDLQRQLGEYFNGQRTVFDLLIDLPGTDFQRASWQELMQVPYGTTKSYSQQALAMGNPAAVRAVARANGMNRISIVIPCHRIIGANGALTGYAGGLARKKWLLEMEQQRLGQD